MDEEYIAPETIMCKKCGFSHRVDSYRNVKFYTCPVVNRVILMTEDNNDAEIRPSGEHSETP